MTEIMGDYVNSLLNENKRLIPNYDNTIAQWLRLESKCSHKYCASFLGSNERARVTLTPYKEFSEVHFLSGIFEYRDSSYRL